MMNRRSLHILVLDDNRSFLDRFLPLFPQLLAFSDRFEIKGFSRGDEMLKWIEKNIENIELPLVMADYYLEHDLLTGIDVLSRVRSISTKTKRILYSGYAGRQELEAAFNAGIVHAFFDRENILGPDFSQVVNNLIQKWEEGWRRGRGVCFVIMPFNSPSTGIYQRLFKPAVEDLGFICVRQDERRIINRYIIEDIVKNIREASLVLADISEPNPNVFYELGIAHSLSKPVILFSRSIESAPFDVRSLRICGYQADSESYDMIRNEVSAIIEELEQEE